MAPRATSTPWAAIPTVVPIRPTRRPAQASGPIYFRRAEEQRQVMLDFGDDVAGVGHRVRLGARDRAATWASTSGWRSARR